MPELPEVETVRRTAERVLKGHRIAAAFASPDEIVLKGRSAEEIQSLLCGARVVAVGRKGKYWWLELDRKPWLFCHLGMAGWVREVGAPTIRLREHGNAPFEDAEGNIRFLKLLLENEGGAKIAFTDGRRLSRIWLANSPEEDRAVRALGPDCYSELPSVADLERVLAKRSAPIKALLLNQELFAGIGNWIADEALWHAKVAPARLGSSLTRKEIGALRGAIEKVVDLAVEVGADSTKYPKDWLFHARWGGKKGIGSLGKHEIVREKIGGRTTAWCPSVQK